MKNQLLLTGLLGLLAASSQAQTWDLKNDFSLTQNPNGAWNYGKYLGNGTFSTNDTVGNFFGFADGWLGDGGSGRPFVGINDSGSTVAGSDDGQVILHPDYISADHPYAGVHWIVPTDGTFDVSVTFYAGDTNSVNEFVSVNASSYIGVHGDETADWTLNFTQTMTAGDFLDFFVGPNSSGDPTSGTTPLDIHIVNSSAVPEPASLCVLSLGALAMLRRRKSAA